MTDLQGELAYFRMRLRKETRVTRDLIRAIVDGGPFSTLLMTEREMIIKELEASFDITQTNGSSVHSPYTPWLPGRRAEIDFFYWDRLRRYYLETGQLPPQVVAALDKDTDDILGYCGNPAHDAAWRRRGMVMGHVQSGKTTNYSALIAKAADAGYKIIILLAGITNSLRAQTQERLDQTFIGRKSLFQKIASEELAITAYSSVKRFPAYGTTRDSDFSKQSASTYGVTLAALKEPVIFVTKKNKATLEALRNWVREQNAGREVDYPLLLIDDEADNASVNTGDAERVTAINKAIREILSYFSRSTYIGYTATPFANIFIDPDSDDEMLKEDLFPKDFIKALDPPSNYVGAHRIFTERGDLKEPMIRLLDDYDSYLPLRHKRDLPLAELPPSLVQAVRIFVLAMATRYLRGDGKKHCSMMINVSRFNDVQEKIYGLVYQYVQELGNAVRLNAGLGRKGLSNKHLQSLSEDFRSEYPDIGCTFDDVLTVLPEAMASIEIRTVNMRGQSLDYSRYSDTGLHVIAIGGLALSRGLTLEGLCVSYILRNASASDTLMQMARWFGYRQNYESLCRLYIPAESAGHYEFITDAIEELRSEIKRMERQNMTPAEFGLRVRHSPAAIRITAANKMQTATSITVAQDYSGRHIEGFALPNSREANLRNHASVTRFIERLKEPTRKLGTMFWENVAAESVVDLVRTFEFTSHPDLTSIDGRTSLFLDYVGDRLASELRFWDVALPVQSGAADLIRFSPFGELPLRRRHSGVINDGIFKFTASNRVAVKGDEALGLEKAALDAASTGGELSGTDICRLRSRPLLILHVVSVKLRKDQAAALLIESPAVTLSFCLPGTDIKPLERIYQVNKVYKRQFEPLAEDRDDDVDLLMETGNV